MLNNLYVIAPEYFSFVKDQTETTAQYFENVRAFIRYNPLSEVSSIWPGSGLESFRLNRRVNLQNLPSNVSVVPTPLYYLPTDRSYKLLGDAHYKKVRKRLVGADINNSLIHAHHTWSAGHVGARLKDEFGVPLVVTGHGYDIYSLPFKDQEWREKIENAMNSADHIITVSKSNLACIQKLDVSTPVTVIPNGFRSDLFFPRDSLECRRALNLPQDKKIILTVGNMESVKGQKYLVDAVQKIIQERKDILCVIIGNGNLRTSLGRQIRSLMLDDFIVLAGWKPHNEIPIWMGACDLLILPSLRESFGVVQVEALACGKPIVTTRNGGSEEVINSDDYGLLVEPGNPDALAENILIALNRDWERDAILRYAKRFTWEIRAEEIIGVYKKVLR